MLHADTPPTAARTVPAWDLPTRLFKWSLVALVVMAPVSQRYGGLDLAWHRYNGYAILILIVFRVLWGFVGSSTSRFSAWVSWPWTAARYGLDLATGNRRRPYLSHNPLGAWMILALLGVLFAQGIAGLFTVDSNGIAGGPFANLDPLSDPTPVQRALTRWHHRAVDYILILAVIHVGVNLFYQFVKKDPIIKAMITGRKPVEPFEDQPAMQPARASGVKAVLCLAAASALVLGTIKLFGGTLS